MIWYKVGAADEAPGKSGLAHFLEHLMFKGTAKHPAGEFSHVVASLGGQENAFTTDDYTGYFQRVPSEHLKTVMELRGRPHDRPGAHRRQGSARARRDPGGAEPARRQQSARASRRADRRRALSQHPYGKPTIGWRQEMEKLNRDDAIGFYRRFYGPNNAVVVIAGDVEPEQVLALAKETYGKVERNNDIMPRLRAAGAAAGGGASAHHGGRARRTADRAARLSGAVFRDRQARRVRGAGSAGAYPRRRHQQPALPRSGGGQANRGRRRRLVRQHLARHDANSASTARRGRASRCPSSRRRSTR